VGVHLDASQLERFSVYLGELLEWNLRFNLTALTEPEEILIKHFVDSLTPLPYLDRCASLLDIGSGAGFPGVPLKIAAPRLQVGLAEPNRKKISFLKHLIRTLALEGITAIPSRMENLSADIPRFQVAVSRALRRPEALIRSISPALAPGNLLLAMLGPVSEQDRTHLQRVGAQRSLELIRTVSLNLPGGRGERSLLFFQKAARGQ
jgi:16S rRNA (guanine527-N7)-methyltransferase